MNYGKVGAAKAIVFSVKRLGEITRLIGGGYQFTSRREAPSMVGTIECLAIATSCGLNLGGTVRATVVEDMDLPLHVPVDKERNPAKGVSFEIAVVWDFSLVPHYHPLIRIEDSVQFSFKYVRPNKYLLRNFGKF
jgi:hypothetical protein